MAADAPLTPGRFLARWVFASFSGWIYGFIAIALLSALADVLRFGGAVYIGLGMGWSIGFTQWRVARKWLRASTQWMWASTVGLAICFLVLDLLPERWGLKEEVALQAGAAVGGLLVGVWQSRMVSPTKARGWFVAASTAGWWLGAALPTLLAVPGHPNGPLQAIRNIGTMLLGGLVLGVVTGCVLMRVPAATSGTSGSVAAAGSAAG